MIVATLRDGILAGIIEVGNILDPAAVFVGIFTAIDDNGVNTVLADLTEPAGDPGLRTAVTAWSAGYTMIDGRRAADGPLVQFRPADETEACVAIGWYLATAAAAGSLLQFGYFEAPVPLPDENAAVSVIPRITVDPDGRWDATISFNG